MARFYEDVNDIPEGVLVVDTIGSLSIGLVGGIYRVNWAELIAHGNAPGIPLDYLILNSERNVAGGYLELIRTEAM